MGCWVVGWFVGDVVEDAELWVAIWYMIVGRRVFACGLFRLGSRFVVVCRRSDLPGGISALDK